MTESRSAELRRRVEALSEGQRVALADALGADTVGPARLVAWVAAPEAVSTESIHAWARERLPGYMVPSRIVRVDELPRTAAGKLDRKALRAREAAAPEAPPADPDTGATWTEAQHVLADIWKAVLDTDEIDIHDDFFELGGDSILSIRVISRAKQAGLPITPQAFFESPTIAALAEAAEEPDPGP